MPRQEIDAALARLPSSLAGKLRGRWEMLTFLEGGGSWPPTCAAFLASNDTSLRRLALQCLLQGGDATSLPLIINCLEDDDPEVRAIASRSLPNLALRHGLGNPPAAERSTAPVWRQWWLGLCRIAACSDDRATIVLPDGRQRQVTVGSPFEFHGRVTRIQPGVGPNNPTGARVEISLAEQTFLIRQ